MSCPFFNSFVLIIKICVFLNTLAFYVCSRVMKRLHITYFKSCEGKIWHRRSLIFVTLRLVNCQNAGPGILALLCESFIIFFQFCYGWGSNTIYVSSERKMRNSQTWKCVQTPGLMLFSIFVARSSNDTRRGWSSPDSGPGDRSAHLQARDSRGRGHRSIIYNTGRSLGEIMWRGRYFNRF